ncbi:ubiquitin-like small modifier protein SAMP2 [Halobellus sp. GM3]|uniref:ubiquitin-like small modifier protein SAMP2 n=1 Tax=Halobellus sp. GM3 TaxID=3458410 RepID=UPI00403DF0CE
MRVSVEVVGEGEEDVEVGDDETYADVVRAVGYSPHEVSVIVDGRPVPEDQSIEASQIRVLRLIKGGGA